jgi:hypothetical protein
MSAGYFVDIALLNPAILLSVGIDGRERSSLRNIWNNNCQPNRSQRERQPAVIPKIICRTANDPGVQVHAKTSARH